MIARQSMWSQCGNGYPVFAHSIPFQGRLSAEELADFQMFLALRKRQRRATQAESITATATASTQGSGDAALASAGKLGTTPDQPTLNLAQAPEPTPSSHGHTAATPHLPNGATSFHQIGTTAVNMFANVMPPIPNGQRTYQCRFCPRLLSSSSNRSRHEREQHHSSNTGGRRSKGQKRSAAEAGVVDVDLSASAAGLAVEMDHDSPTKPAISGAVVPVPTPTAATAIAVPLAEGVVMGGDDIVDSAMAPADDITELPASESVAPATTTSSVEQGETTTLYYGHVPGSGDNSTACATNSEPTAEVESKSPQHDICPQPSPFEIMAAERDQQLQQACVPFLQWLCQPPMTEVEALVKARRVRDSSQLKPHKLNLRFIFGLLLESKAVMSIQLDELTQLAVCQKLASALDQRNVGGARVHALFLLVKKVLTFLASSESTRRGQFITPNTYSSFMFVDAVCSESSQRRKQDARNRALLGVQSSKALQKQQQFSASGVSTMWDMSSDAFKMPSLGGLADRLAVSPPAVTAQTVAAAAAAANKAVAQPQSSLAVTSASHLKAPVAPGAVPLANGMTALSNGEEPSANETLTTDQLVQATKGSLAYLQTKEPTFFVHHLVTATLCLGMAPRSQVLSELRVGSSLIKKEDGRYWVLMLAEQNKNRKPTLFPLAEELTAHYDYYLDVLRPQLLKQSGVEPHDYVFFKKNGTAPRADFGKLTSAATLQTIGQAKNPHAFRSSVTTALYTTGNATQHDMNMLARVMAHDPTTARNYYYRPQMAQAALDTHERMRQVLQLSGAASTYSGADSIAIDASQPQPDQSSQQESQAAASSSDSSALVAEALQLDL